MMYVNFNYNGFDEVMEKYFVVIKEIQETFGGSPNQKKSSYGFLRVLWFLKTDFRRCLQFKQIHDIFCE